MDGSEILSVFCQNIDADINKRIAQLINDSESQVLLHTYKEKCKAILSEIDKKKEKVQQDPKLLKDIAQLVLDVTYMKEIQLVDEDFAQESVESDIKYIIDSLTSLEVLAKSLRPKEEVIASLGPEIVECLRWRKGALLYMFGHTIYHLQPAQGIPSNQLHYMEEGIDFLVSMLKTRSDAKWMDSAIDQLDDSDTLQLIQQGIFSDTHLLALMYCGEMCYWHASTLNRANTATEKSNAQKGACEKVLSSSIPPENDIIAKSSESQNDLEQQTVKSSDSKNDSTTSKVSNLGAIKKCSANLETNDHLIHSDVSNENNEGLSETETDTNLSKFIKIGNSCLKMYLTVVQGPLASAGWSTNMAEDIIGHFQTLNLS